MVCLLREIPLLTGMYEISYNQGKLLTVVFVLFFCEDNGKHVLPLTHVFVSVI